jgi:putative Holliday junction resolvase
MQAYPTPRAMPERGSAFASSGTILAFDFGKRHIGVAVGDAATALAHPLEHIDAEANEQRFARIAALIAEWRPGRLLVGLPLAADGAEHDLTRRARRFGRQLEGRFGLPVDFADERYTSLAAESSLRAMGRGGQAHKDLGHALAAQLVLQDYLDRSQRRENELENEHDRPA